MLGSAESVVVNCAKRPGLHGECVRAGEAGLRQSSVY
jgi:hypothetical protein